VTPAKIYSLGIEICVISSRAGYLVLLLAGATVRLETGLPSRTHCNFLRLKAKTRGCRSGSPECSDLLLSSRRNSKEISQVLWTTAAEAAFRELKARLKEEPVLLQPDTADPFTIETDASE
jgi:hypothetical protein